jgi:PKD repeat protein
LAGLAILALVLVPAAGQVIPSYHDVNLKVANDAGARFDDYGDDTYNFFNLLQSPSQGLNALHISTDPSAATEFGQVTTTGSQSGTFYVTDTGGRGWDDDGVLMLAINGTVPDGFQVHVRASGYRWTPVAKDVIPPFPSVTYYPVTLDETFTKADFVYGPQIWKPCPAANYPIYDGQDMADVANTFSILFVDLNAGILGTNSRVDPTYEGQTLTNNGAIKVEYSFTNLNTFAAFDAYAYCQDSNQGRGIRWTNRLSELGASGYSVIGQSSAVVALPGQANAPTDPDHDGRYEDVSGNGATSFTDVVLFFKNIDWIAANEPVSAFDFSGNGAIAFKDIQLLFQEV